MKDRWVADDSPAGRRTCAGAAEEGDGCGGDVLAVAVAGVAALAGRVGRIERRRRKRRRAWKSGRLCSGWEAARSGHPSGR